MKLSGTDLDAVNRRDSDHLLRKGMKAYERSSFIDAVEYFQLASTMDNETATLRLGDCYLYGKGVKPNLNLAISYYVVAADKGKIDAYNRLSDVYSSNEWGFRDEEKSVYYLCKGAKALVGRNWDDPGEVYYCGILMDYPDLCFALAKEIIAGHYVEENPELAYQYLDYASYGYRDKVIHGAKEYQSDYDEVLELMDQPMFDGFQDIDYDWPDFENVDDDDDDDLPFF